MFRIGAAAWAAMALLGLAACDGGASAVAPAREHAAAPATSADSYASDATANAPTQDPRDAPIPKFDGKPMWSANRRFTAEENAQRHFERNGADFGATSVQAYVAKAHAFVDNPPAGAETVKRPNGDLLVYDPKANIFAVATREGAPRTMFKPDDGAAYWEKQKDQAKNGGSRRQASGGGDQG